MVIMVIIYIYIYIMSKGVPICKSVLVSVPISKASAKPIFAVFYWPILN